MLEDIYRATHGVFKDKTGPREQGVTHFIMGHSMGAMLVTAYLEKYPPKNDGSNWLDDIEGAILSAPAFQPGFPVPFLKRHVGSFLSKFLGSFNIPTELDANGISRDPQEVEKYKKDPLIHDKGSLRLCKFSKVLLTF
jgi:alpha-beta hydrolase superfamily lysophospholipase